MTVKYYAILTNQGAARLANATMLGSKLNLTQMAVGDANGVLPTPDPAQTKLINQKRIAPLNLLSVDPNNQSQIIAEQIIPENEGGFWIREIGLYDDEGVLIAVANCPETYKPQLQEGSGRTQTIRMILVVTNTEAITLKIDPSVVLATRKYVDDEVLELRLYVDDQMRNHIAAQDPHTQYAQKHNPTFTGEPKAPTPDAGNNTTRIATTAFVQAAITALINGAPATLDTLKEIAAAINNDPKFSTTINNALALKAPLSSPALTGTPTAPTAAQSVNNTQIATTAFVKSAIAAMVGSAPAALDTLNELAAALGNDPNFSTTVLNALAGKQPLDNTLTNLSGKDVAGLLAYLGLGEISSQYIKQAREPLEITVGDGGDFSSLSSAIYAASEMRYVAAKANTGITIRLLPDFVLKEQVIIDFADLSFITITAVGTVTIDHSSLVNAVDEYYPVLCARNGARFPVVDALFDMSRSGQEQDKTVAVLAYGAGSSVKVNPEKGCINSFGAGLIASHGASFSADYSVWNDCGGDGVSVYAGATGSAKFATADRCYNGFVANGGVLDATSARAQSAYNAGFVARKSGVLNAEFADGQNSENYGFYAAVSSLLNVTRGNCSGSRFGISAQRGSKIAAEEVTADNCTETNISARRYSEIEAQSCHAVNTTTSPLYCIRANYSGAVIVESGVIGGACTSNICRATTNAEIQATDAVMSGATGLSIAVFVDESSNFNGRRMKLDHTTSQGTAVQVMRGSTADISDSVITGGGNYGIVSQYCANIAADNAEIHGSVNYSVYACDGGKISVTNANVRRDAATDQITDIVISRGGIISASGAVGGVNATTNTVSASGTVYR
ncbi:hypothetical protein ESCOCP332M_15575 [Escherichia coli]|nr:phage tail protein [Escherichia coli]MDW7073342.1 phage tail protein [Escherichia coli]